MVAAEAGIMRSNSMKIKVEKENWSKESKQSYAYLVSPEKGADLI